MRIPRFLAATSLAVASVFFATSAATAVMPDGWQDPIQVSNMAVRHGPFLATSGESTMAVWKGTDDQGYFSVTTDGGATWGAVSSFSDPQHSVQLIAITSLEGGGFAVGYVTTSAVYVRTVNALGTSWSSFISQSADSPDAIILAAMTTEQVAVGVRAIDSTKYTAQIGVVDITSATLSPFQTISGTANTISNPTITFSNGILSAIWEPPVSGQVEQRYSDNFGATWSTTSSLAVDGTRSPNRTQIFGCGDQLILLAGSSASDGYAKVFARNADYSNSWTNLVSATSRSVMTKDAACLSGGRLLSVWTLGDYTVEYSLSTFTQGSWSSTPVASAPITSANIVTVAPTPDGGAAVATTGATIPGKTFGLKWTSDNSWGTQTLLYEVIGAAGQYPVPDVIDSVETSTGAVFAWKDFDLSGRLIPPVTSARIIAPAPAPAPAPTPNPDPALADTGAEATWGGWLGAITLATGFISLVATSASVRRVRAARSRARVR